MYIYSMYIYIYIRFNHQNLSCPCQTFPSPEFPPPSTPRSSVLKTGTLRHQNAMQHLANALDAEVYGGGDVWLGPWHCPCWIGQAMNAEDALVDLRYCTLAVFCFLMMVCGIKMWRDFLLTKNQLKIPHLQLWWLLCFFFPVFCWKNSGWVTY